MAKPDMTEAEWLASEDPTPMLAHLIATGAVSERKRFLFSAACCRRVWSSLVDERSRRAVEVLEQYADGLVSYHQRREAGEAAHLAREASGHRYGGVSRYLLAAHAAVSLTVGSTYAATDTAASVALAVGSASASVLSDADEIPAYSSRRAASELVAQAALLRDIFPFRASALDPVWLGGTAKKLAQVIYDKRAFDRLPILADALEDSGCSNQDILQHCRGGGEHVRGCWVADLLIGKEQRP